MQEIDGSNPSGISWKFGFCYGLLVQREDAWLAPRRSGFNSPAGPMNSEGSLVEFEAMKRSRAPRLLFAFEVLKTEGSRIRLAGLLC